MITDARLASLCSDVYLPPAHLEVGSDLALNLLVEEDTAIVAFRGTANIAGWRRDVNALPKSHELLGYVHQGFLSGACALMQLLDIPSDKRVVLTGHSLGGALAVVLGALRVATAERVDELVTFGAPRAGYREISQLFASSGTLVRQYRRGNDPIPEVPASFAAFPYMHAREPLIQIGDIETPHSVFSDLMRGTWHLSHSILGYIADVTAHESRVS